MGTIAWDHGITGQHGIVTQLGQIQDGRFGCMPAAEGRVIVDEAKKEAGTRKASDEDQLKLTVKENVWAKGALELRFGVAPVRSTADTEHKDQRQRECEDTLSNGCTCITQLE